MYQSPRHVATKSHDHRQQSVEDLPVQIDRLQLVPHDLHDRPPEHALFIRYRIVGLADDLCQNCLISAVLSLLLELVRRETGQAIDGVFLSECEHADVEEDGGEICAWLVVVEGVAEVEHRANKLPVILLEHDDAGVRLLSMASVSCLWERIRGAMITTHPEASRACLEKPFRSGDQHHLVTRESVPAACDGHVGESPSFVEATIVVSILCLCQKLPELIPQQTIHGILCLSSAVKVVHICLWLTSVVGLTESAM